MFGMKNLQYHAVMACDGMLHETSLCFLLGVIAAYSGAQY